MVFLTAFSTLACTQSGVLGRLWASRYTSGLNLQRMLNKHIDSFYYPN